MGRHSAPDDGADGADSGVADPTAPVLVAPEHPGRHAHADPDDHHGLAAPAGPIGPIGRSVVAEAQTVEQPAVAAPLRPDNDTGPGDLLSLDEPDEPDEPPAPVAPPVAVPVEPVTAGPTPDVPPAAAADLVRGTAADLALVRRHAGVRARVAAGVLVPFIVYVVVLVAAGATVRQGLLWIFVPLVVAGVLAGVFLDLGHKQQTGPPPAEDR